MCNSFTHLQFTKMLTLCIELSSNVDAYIAESHRDNLQGEGFKLNLEPGRTVVRNANKILSDGVAISVAISTTDAQAEHAPEE